MLYAKVTNPAAGYKYDSEKATELKSRIGDNEIVVTRIEIGRSSTACALKDERLMFNSVNLEFYVKDSEGQLEEYDIWENKLNIECIQNMYIALI